MNTETAHLEGCKDKIYRQLQRAVILEQRARLGPTAESSDEYEYYEESDTLSEADKDDGVSE